MNKRSNFYRSLNTPLEIVYTNKSVVHEFGYIEHRSATQVIGSSGSGYIFDKSSYFIVIRDNVNINKSSVIKYMDMHLKIQSIYKKYRLQK